MQTAEMHASPSESSILYTNYDQDIILLDIPRSIELATGITAVTGKRLVSGRVIDQPFTSTEPKSDKARDRLQRQNDHDVDVIYSRILDNALTTLHSAYKGPWCYSRLEISSEPVEQQLGKRKQSSGQNIADNEAAEAEVKAVSDDPVAGSRILWSKVDAECDLQDQSHEQWSNLAVNETDDLLRMSLAPKEEVTQQYYIPASSATFVADCQDGSRFRSEVRNQCQQHESPSRFDTIIMDPPWPNASVRRGHRKNKGHYAVQDTLSGIEQLLHGMDIDLLLAQDGLLCIWITNKPSIRDLVLGENGLFDALGVELVEEWVWVKITAKGLPILPIDGLWRKPYEVLLIGRKRALAGYDNQAREDGSSVKRRVIAAVPDMHSRKPCLKELLRAVHADTTGKPLEVFARYPVCGWWSWGDQALKFAHTRHWTHDQAETHAQGDAAPVD